jgi:hypothetical protein
MRPPQMNIPSITRILLKIKSFLDEGTLTIMDRELPWAVILFVVSYIIVSLWVYLTIIFV